MAPFLTQLVSKCQDSPQIDIDRQIDIALQIYMALQIQRWPSKYIWPSRYIWPSKYRALQTNGCEEKNTEDKHRRQSHEHTDTVRSQQKVVCENIEHENQEYEG